LLLSIGAAELGKKAYMTVDSYFNAFPPFEGPENIENKNWM